MRKEITLSSERSKQGDNNTILPSEWIEDLRMMHILLQSVRRPITIRNGKPYTVMVVNLHEEDSEGGNYWYRDNLFHPVLAIRSGEVGIIVALEDGGINEKAFKNYVRDVNGRKLTSIQFEELYVKTVYQTSLLKAHPKFIMSAHLDESKPMYIHMFHGAGLGQGTLLRNWDQEEFANILYLSMKHWMDRMNLRLEDIFLPPDQVMTWMTDEHGSPRIIDENK